MMFLVLQPTDIAAVRESYDRVADNYVEILRPGWAASADPWLCAALDVYAEAVRGLGPVLDVGCGPGTVTAHLAELGVDVSGVDLSPRMIEHARRLHPECRFSVSSSTELELRRGLVRRPDGLVVAVQPAPRRAAQVLATYAQALVPGGQVIIGTHVGDGEVQRTECYGGVPVNWTTHLYRPEDLNQLLTEAGLEVVVELRWPAQPSRRPQVLLVARRPG